MLGSVAEVHVTVDEAKFAVALFRGPQILAVTLESYEGGSGAGEHRPAEHAVRRTRRTRQQTCANQYRIGTVVHLVAHSVAGLRVHRVDVGRVLGADAGVRR